MYPTITVITDTMTASGMFLQESGRDTHKEQALNPCYAQYYCRLQLALFRWTHKLISSCIVFVKAMVPQRLVTQDDFFPALPFRSDQLFTHKAGLEPARWEQTGTEFESCLGHQSAAHEAPSLHTYQPEYANMPA